MDHQQIRSPVRWRAWMVVALLTAGWLRPDTALAGPMVLEGLPAGPYTLELRIEPSPLRAGEPAMLVKHLTRTRTREPVRNLQVVHERVFHNFIVALDFSSFDHIHHEDFVPITAADRERATYRFPYTFPGPGPYRMVSEFTHRNQSWTKHFDIEVGDSPTATAPIPVDLAREILHQGIQARLQTSPTEPVAGFETELVLTLHRDDQPVRDLELFLGSEVHMALWRIDGRHFGHAHAFTPHMAAMMAGLEGKPAPERGALLADMTVAMLDMPARRIYPGPTIPLRYTFPEAGVYVLFLQCAPGGDPQVFRFMLEVAAYTEGVATRVESIVSTEADH